MSSTEQSASSQRQRVTGPGLQKSPNPNGHDGRYPPPQRGASLLLAFRGVSSTSSPSPSSSSLPKLESEEAEQKRRIALIIDRTAQTRLAASRALAALEADFRVVVLTWSPRAWARCRGDGFADSSSNLVSCPESFGCDDELRWRAQIGELEIRNLSEFLCDSVCKKDSDEGEDEDACALSAFLSSHSRSHNDNHEAPAEASAPSVIALAFITDTIATLPASQRRNKRSAASLARVFAAHGIPLNVADMPALCDFTVCATHRVLDFRDNDVAFSSSADVVSGIDGLGDGEEKTQTQQSTQKQAKRGQQRSTPLQIGVTTNGHGCRLGARLRRTLAAALPPEAGVAVEKIARMRELARGHGPAPNTTTAGAEQEDDGGDGGEGNGDGEDEGEGEGEITPNAPVEQRSRTTASYTAKDSESDARSIRRRMKWVAQVSEYMSVKQIAALSDADIERMLSGDVHSFSAPADVHNSSNRETPTLTKSNADDTSSQLSQHSLMLSSPPCLPKNRGCVLLVGSGPGHPSLLTLAAYHALTSLATVILADKLIPAPILALIPPHIPIHTARKFPGNAQHAQDELVDLALAHARRGETVVRLKQGDPALFGRCGEEVRALRREGVKVLAVPGISSALAAPLVCARQLEVEREGEKGEGPVMVTMRGWAESLRVVSGVRRGGVMTGEQAGASAGAGTEGGDVPQYERGQTLVVLMVNARLRAFVRALIGAEQQEQEQGMEMEPWLRRGRERQGRQHSYHYPPYLPAAIIERASLPDQRVVEAALCDIADALESTGEQRPPGLLMLGWTIAALRGGCSHGGDNNRNSDNDNDNDENDDGEILSDAALAGGPEAIERRDRARARRWLGGRRWRVTEGLDPMWGMFDHACGSASSSGGGGSKVVVV